MATLRQAIDIAKKEPNSERSQKLKAAIMAGKMDSIAQQEGINLSPFKDTVKKRLTPGSVAEKLLSSVAPGAVSTAKQFADTGKQVLQKTGEAVIKNPDAVMEKYEDYKEENKTDILREELGYETGPTVGDLFQGFKDKVGETKERVQENEEKGKLTPPSIQRFKEGTKEAFGKALENTKETRNKALAGEISDKDNLVQFLGNVSNILLSPVRGTEEAASPYVEPVVEGVVGAYKNLENKALETPMGQLLMKDQEKLANKIKNTPGVEKALEDIKNWSEKNKENLSAVGSISELVSILFGGSLAKKPLQESLETVGETVTKTFGKASTLANEGFKKGVRLSGDSLNNFKTFLKRTEKPKEALIEAVDNRILEIAEAEQLAREFGVELPASSFATPVKARTEQFLAEGFFGKELKQRAEKAVDDFSQRVDELQAEAPTSSELGENIVNKFKAVEKERKTVIKDLYDQVEDIAAKNEGALTIDNPKSLETLDKLIDRKETALNAGVGTEEAVNNIKKIRNGIANNYDLKTQRAALSEVGDLANFDSFNPTTDEKLYRELYWSMKKDIDASITDQIPELKEVLSEANAKFKQLQDLKERPFAKTIEKLGKAGDVDTIADKLTKTKVSSNEVSQIYETLGPETTLQIQKKIMADIAQKARTASGEGFKPTGFSRQIQSIGKERLGALLTKEQIKAIENFDKLNQLIAKGFSVTKGSQTALLQNFARFIAAPATNFLSIFGELGLAKFFNSKRGQDLLKGIDKKTRKTIEQNLTVKPLKQLQ